MIDILKPYLEEYKESGHSWIGVVPKHWAVLPNRATFSEVKDRNHPDEEMLSVTITRGVIRQQNLLTDSAKKDGSNEDKSAYKLVCPSDLAYNKMRAWQGAIGIAEFRGIISPAYVVMRLRDGNIPRYFHHLYRTPQFAKEAERWSYGITSDMWSLRPEHFKMIYSPVPPADEQAAIVRFLDSASVLSEQAIKSKRKLIALLIEQKQAIIKRAVTRGLDPAVSLKPSGVPWLGEIPAHWAVRKMKYLVSAVGGMTPSKANEGFWRGSIPWVSPKDMKVAEIRDSQDHISEAAVFETGISLIEPPAVLIVVRGMILARTFPCAVSKVPITVNQDMKALLPKTSLSAEFLVSLLTGIERELLTLVEEAAHGTRCLRTDSWENLAVPVPPIYEQIEINAALKKELQAVDIAVTRVQREIALLREYQTRLVADVVTGKLDVTAAELSAPEVVDEIEPLVDSTELEDDEAGLVEENAHAEN